MWLVAWRRRKTAAFDEYEKQKELKRQLEREIEAVRMSYIDYLEQYAPIYYKYMHEWDALCLKKDKAYIDLYEGHPLGAYNQAQQVLNDYPTNREALLLKSLSLIQIEQRGRGHLASCALLERFCFRRAWSGLTLPSLG